MNHNISNDNILKLKLIFLGDQGTGKSSILNRFVKDKFDEEYQATIGLDFDSKIVKIDNQDVRLLLYDTAGQEKFRSLIPMYTRDAQIILLVYDITREESFTNINAWLDELKNIKPEEVIFALVGNKMDLENERKVPKEKGEKFASDKNIVFEEVSAKTGNNFSSLFYKKLFEKIAEKFIYPEKMQQEPDPKNVGKMKIEAFNNKKMAKGGCCK